MHGYRDIRAPHVVRRRFLALAVFAAALLALGGVALNEKYRLGEQARSTASTNSAAAWQRALTIRSDALNRRYGLGPYARNAAGASEPAWLRALMIRSDALNRQYKLGKYAPGG